MDEQSHWFHFNKQKCEMNEILARKSLFPWATAIQLADSNLSAWSLPSMCPVMCRLPWEMTDHFTGKYPSCERVSYKLGLREETHRPRIPPSSPDRSSFWQPEEKCFANTRDAEHSQSWELKMPTLGDRGKWDTFLHFFWYKFNFLRAITLDTTSHFLR